MNPEEITTIDEVIAVLEDIILKSEQTNSPAGYFAALYQKVTIKVKEGIASGFLKMAHAWSNWMFYLPNGISRPGFYTKKENPLPFPGKKLSTFQPTTNPLFCSIYFWE